MSASHKSRFSPRPTPAVAVETTTEAVAPAVAVTLTSLAETPAETPAPEAMSAETAAQTEAQAEDDDSSSATVSTDAQGVVSSTFNIRTTPVLPITVVRKFQPSFGAGVLTDLHRSMLNKFCEEQFQTWATNKAKSRAKKLAKAATEAEKHENRVYTVADYLQQWAEFTPHVAERGPKQDPKQKLIEETALEYWDNKVTAHNAAVARGEPGLIPSRLGQTIPPRIFSKAEFAQMRNLGRFEDGKWITSQEATQPYKQYLAESEKTEKDFVAKLLASKTHRPAIDTLASAKLTPKLTASVSTSVGAALSLDEID